MSEQMPLGEWIEVYDDFGYGWRLIRPLAIGKEYVFAENADTDDITLPKTYKWRYPIDERKQLEEKILSEWRTKSIDYAHDHFDHIPKLWMLQWMIDNGVSVE